MTFPYLRAHRAVQGGCCAARSPRPSLISSSAAKTHRLIVAADQETGGRAAPRGSGRPAAASHPACWRGRGRTRRGLRGGCRCGGGARGTPEGLRSTGPPHGASGLPRRWLGTPRGRGRRWGARPPAPLSQATPGARLTELLVTSVQAPADRRFLTLSLCFFAVNEIIRNDLSSTNVHA